MTLVLGVDGCPGGWCGVAIDSDTKAIVDARAYQSFADVLDSAASVICVDIPIGLLDVPGQRACDVEARRLLGRGRASSVFSPPSRRSLSIDHYRAASEMNFHLTSRWLNKQSFNIGPKIREVDEAIKPGMQDRVREAHPELCFWALNGGVAMRHNKKTRLGREERWGLLREVLPELGAAPVMPLALRGSCGIDDYLDALACAWTAAHIVRGRASRIPPDLEVDERGLRMEMWLPTPTRPVREDPVARRR